MRIVCISWLCLHYFGCGNRSRQFEVWGRLFLNPSNRRWFMSEIEGPVSDNLGRTELFCYNVWFKIFGMILVIGFVFEECGKTYINSFIIFCGSAYGFVDSLSWHVGTRFMLHVMRLLEVDMRNDLFCLCKYIRSIWLSILI